MTDVNEKFIRMGDRTWITRSASGCFDMFSHVRPLIKNAYPDALVKIIEDVQYEPYGMTTKRQIEQAMTNGINSLSDDCISAKYYFIQITFLNDPDNVDFIMQMNIANNPIKKCLDGVWFCS